MERELKWQADRALQEAVAAWAQPFVVAQTCIQMDARYFDTADGLLQSRRAGLRLRLQNGESVCCLKCGGGVSGAEHVREEYECRAADIEAGLCGLAAAGAPATLLSALAAHSVHEICRTAFTRHALTLHADEMTAELALDCGFLSRAGREAVLCEIELEHISGAQADFYAFSNRLNAAFPLIPEPLSKLARALSL